MRFQVTGLNHKTAPIELRERLAIGKDALPELTQALMGQPSVKEAMILSTCNRVELLVSHNGTDPQLPQFLAQRFSVDRSMLEPHLYRYQDEEAVKHMFRVAASLDSMVVGEAQILGQVKQSWTVARELGAVKGPLDKLLQGAFSAAKRVRSETEIGSSSVSIASVAVDLARRIFGSLEGKRILVIGAGKMSELAARHMMQHGADSIRVANRTFDRAVRLAEQFLGEAIRFEELHARAHEADIIITSTGSSEQILSVEQAQEILRRRKNQPVFVIDIAVPRDVDPRVNRLEGMFLYDIDDLQSVASSNLVDRGREAERAEAIIAEETERFRRRIRTIDIAPAIVDVQGTAEELRQAELHRQRQLLQSLTPEQAAAVESLSRGLMNKFLHLPLQAMKAAAREGDAAALETIRGMFQRECGAHRLEGQAAQEKPESETPEAGTTRTGADNDVAEP
ncbi:MAG TPA: glutamyl-tRNA reductase [Acidobacteriaceae bacterium]|jgi:glutamyl-tRNA reductase|nr:glutamyl-tRNA reductase [Acidobacteriaceae bacterium]